MRHHLSLTVQWGARLNVPTVRQFAVIDANNDSMLEMAELESFIRAAKVRATCPPRCACAHANSAGPGDGAKGKSWFTFLHLQSTS